VHKVIEGRVAVMAGDVFEDVNLQGRSLLWWLMPFVG